MSSRARKCICFLGIGATVGLLILVTLIVLLTTSKGNLVNVSLARLFETINKPLELLPWAKDLGQRQNPILTLGFLAAYWGLLGLILGWCVFLIWNVVFREKHSPSPRKP